MIKILKFYSQSCGPCKAMEPAVKKFILEHGAEVIGVDVEEATELAAKYRVRSVPTVIFEKDGTVLRQLVGMQSYEELTEVYEGIQRD